MTQKETYCSRDGEQWVACALTSEDGSESPVANEPKIFVRARGQTVCRQSVTCITVDQYQSRTVEEQLTSAEQPGKHRKVVEDLESLTCSMAHNRVPRV